MTDPIINTCEWYDASCHLSWIGDELDYWALRSYEKILNGAASIFEGIQVPSFMADVGTHTLPSGVSWAASAFQLDVGIGIIVSAYIARFILRRIPIIG